MFVPQPRRRGMRAYVEIIDDGRKGLGMESREEVLVNSL